MKANRPTVADILALKGKRQLSMLRVVTLEEAQAAEKAGIEMVSVPPALLGPAFREAAPTVFAVPGLEYGDFVTAEEYLRAAFQAMRAGGARIVHASYRYARVLAEVDPMLLPALAALPGVTAIHPDYGAQRRTGAVMSQSEALVRADTGRERFAVDGTGVRVGVLSDSFNQGLGGAIAGDGCERRLTNSSPQFSGDLPAQVVVLDDGPRFSTDEGAALAEIVHDIAPGAELMFASAYPSEAAFAEGIERLVACGADLLVDDVLFFAEPIFQDGLVAQAADGWGGTTVLGAGFAREPQVKAERLTLTAGRRPVVMLGREGPSGFARDEEGRRRDLGTSLLPTETALAALQDAVRFPEIQLMRQAMTAWRFNHDFRTDADSPLRRPNLEREPVLRNRS